MTIEQNPIFVVNSFTGDWWEYERTLEHPDSKEPITQRIMVGKVNKTGEPRGVLKQIHQQVFYQLLQLWGKQNYPIMECRKDEREVTGTVGVIKTTGYELVKYLRGSDAQWHYNRVQDIIQYISTIPIRCEYWYAWKKTKDVQLFTLLLGMDWYDHTCLLKIKSSSR